MKKIWKPTSLGTIIAERRLAASARGKSNKLVRIRVGAPVRGPRAKHFDPWICPIQTSGFGGTEFLGIAGQDSMQALVLALQYLTRHLPTFAKQSGYRLNWLGEEEKLIFADTFLLDLMSKALSNFSVGAKAVVHAFKETKTLSAKQCRAIEKLQILHETQGHRTSRPPRATKRLTRRRTK